MNPRRRGEPFNGFLDPRKIDLNCCALANLACDSNPSSALVYRPVDTRQTQAGALIPFLGSEEGFENTRPGFAVHSVAGIPHSDHNVRPTLGPGINCFQIVVYIGICSANR